MRTDCYRRGLLQMAGLAAVLTAVLTTAAPSLAQDFPSRAIRVVLPFAPGGGTDILARVLSQRLQESMGQNVVVDNRAGAGGNIGAEIVTRSVPDATGATELVGFGSAIVPYADDAAGVPAPPVLVAVTVHFRLHASSASTRT